MFRTGIIPLALVSVVLLADCTGAGVGSSGPSLQQSATMYNEMLRWGTPMGGLEYVASDERDGFVNAVQDSADSARVLEVEVQAVRMDDKGTSAEVFVSFLWTAGDSITTIASVQKQTWKRTKRIWRIHAATAVGDDPTPFTW